MIQLANKTVLITGVEPLTVTYCDAFSFADRKANRFSPTDDSDDTSSDRLSVTAVVDSLCVSRLIMYNMVAFRR